MFDQSTPRVRSSQTEVLGTRGTVRCTRGKKCEVGFSDVENRFVKETSSHKSDDDMTSLDESLDLEIRVIHNCEFSPQLNFVFLKNFYNKRYDDNRPMCVNDSTS